MSSVHWHTCNWNDTNHSSAASCKPPNVSVGWCPVLQSTCAIHNKSRTVAWCIEYTAITTRTCMMLWELRYISTVPGNHFSGMCMAPMAPPSADTASYMKHISDIDSTFSTGVKLSLWCNSIAALSISYIYNCNRYLVLGTQHKNTGFCWYFLRDCKKYITLFYPYFKNDFIQLKMFTAEVFLSHKWKFYSLKDKPRIHPVSWI